MRYLIFLCIWFSALTYGITTKLRVLKVNNLANLLFDLYELRDDIQVQTVRPDLTDAYVQELIRDTDSAIIAAGGDFHAAPPFGLVAKAREYFDFVKSVTADFPPVVSPDAVVSSNQAFYVDDEEDEYASDTDLLLEDEDAYAAGAYLNPFTETIISDENIFMDTDLSQISSTKDSSPLSIVSDPDINWSPTRRNGAGGRGNYQGSPIIRYNGVDDFEEEKTQEPVRGTRRNLRAEFDEEEINQNSGDPLDSPLWYPGVLGPEPEQEGDDSFDMAAYEAGV
ncbi:hypothetical protein H072_6715 [Dactylellina haptotyla CBS 200.50]|uniref:Uncharacterized protein n=1 Tax=Dactylellina haptotyla (strain CBS 200.50) TaxID=1284197 RepID=S8BW16_DACHA|nr:hypothetical protein H072_6715 [Dactylellina haptotyla CBS 200.50]